MLYTNISIPDERKARGILAVGTQKRRYGGGSSINRPLNIIQR